MIISFKDDGTRDIFFGLDTRAARRACPNMLWRTARKRLQVLDHAARLKDLAEPPGNQLKPLKGDRRGQFSIRINDQYRVCFWWMTDGPSEVEITDYH